MTGTVLSKYVNIMPVSASQLKYYIPSEKKFEFELGNDVSNTYLSFISEMNAHSLFASYSAVSY